jgi:hypothetical protein
MQTIRSLTWRRLSVRSLTWQWGACLVALIRCEGTTEIL